jgi:hypothetical protein
MRGIRRMAEVAHGPRRLGRSGRRERAEAARMRLMVIPFQAGIGSVGSGGAGRPAQRGRLPRGSAWCRLWLALRRRVRSCAGVWPGSGRR